LGGREVGRSGSGGGRQYMDPWARTKPRKVSYWIPPVCPNRVKQQGVGRREAFHGAVHCTLQVIYRRFDDIMLLGICKCSFTGGGMQYMLGANRECNMVVMGAGVGGATRDGVLHRGGGGRGRMHRPCKRSKVVTLVRATQTLAGRL
jgi:hypothetical protein